MMDLYRQHPIGTSSRYPLRLGLVYLLAAIFTFQSLFLAYNNSTYLETFVSASTVGFLYSIGAAGSILLFFLAPRLLERYGNVVVTLGAMSLIILTLLGLGLAWSVPLVIGSFIIYLAITPVVYLNIDVFTETLIGDNESSTGTTRGLILVIMSIAGFLAPWLMGIVAGENGDLTSLYFVAVGIGFVCIFFILSFFRRFQDEPYEPASLALIWYYLKTNQNIRLVTYNHFLLQLFFTWAVIYIPLYLATEIGFNWSQIGTLIAIGAIAYTLFEFPIGWSADNKIGEKEMMIAGFTILALTVLAISVVGALSFVGWAILLFLSRVGCSFIEVTTESYFFKQTKGRDSNLISLFRMTRPAANLIGALLGGVCLLFLPFSAIFGVLAVILFTGIVAAWPLVDTR